MRRTWTCIWITDRIWTHAGMEWRRQEPTSPRESFMVSLLRNSVAVGTWTPFLTACSEANEGRLTSCSRSTGPRSEIRRYRATPRGSLIGLGGTRRLQLLRVSISAITPSGTLASRPSQRVWITMRDFCFPYSEFHILRNHRIWLESRGFLRLKT